jgi:dipeptidyl aminopeptidase/acylaminoacyl peptidase
VELAVRLIYPGLPDLAELAPHRAVHVDDHAGRCEVYATDARTGGRRLVTDRPFGTVTCAIDPAGMRIWWFDDDASGTGVWRVQRFDGGPDRPALPGVPAGRNAGLAMALDGTVAVGVGGSDGLTVHLSRPRTLSREILRVDGYAQVVDLSPDGTLLAVGGEPDAPDAIRVHHATGTLAATLSGATGRRWVLGFRPSVRTPELLVVTEVDGRYRLETWTGDDGLRPVAGGDYDTEIAASWYPDGRRILVRQDRHARSALFEVDPERGTRSTLPTPDGSLLAAAVQADGVLRYLWTDSATAPELRTGLDRPAHQRAGAYRDIWVDGPGGGIHALVTQGPGDGPGPAVFLLHGGPFEAAMDAYDPMVTILAGMGCVVVRVNYRGSTGYGPTWRHDFSVGVGLTQLADIAAVRAELVRAGVVDPTRTALAGESWGGYLALLAAGVQPDRWCGIAAVSPVADYRLAFRDTTPAIRALDVSLFGGRPDEVPERYDRSSPVTYAAAVTAPVLVVASADDPKCPPAQIHSYLAALRQHGREPAVIWTGHGHQPYDTDGRVDVITAVIRHVGLALGGRTVAA